MKSSFSKTWKRSVQPRKQRKYAYNLPMHSRRALLSVHLSPQLREKHNQRSLPVRVGDKVRVLRGTHKGKEGKVEIVDMHEVKVFVAKIDTPKEGGASSPYPLTPSNLMLIELKNDKRRLNNTK